MGEKLRREGSYCSSCVSDFENRLTRNKRKRTFAK